MERQSVSQRVGRSVGQSASQMLILLSFQTNWSNTILFLILTDRTKVTDQPKGVNNSSTAKSGKEQ